MKPFRPGSSYKAPYFTATQIDNMCCDELLAVGLLPTAPEPIRIDRFIEKRFKVPPQYEDLPDGVLGFTRFGKNGVKAVVISAALDSEGGKVASRRVRTTIAHEGGHGLLHAHLFALDEIPLHLFDQDSHSEDQILCRDVYGDERKAHRHDGRWWEVQANRAMSSLLCPRALVQKAMKPFLSPAGQLGVEVLGETRREEAVRALAEAFDVNPEAAESGFAEFRGVRKTIRFIFFRPRLQTLKILLNKYPKMVALANRLKAFESNLCRARPIAHLIFRQNHTNPAIQMLGLQRR